jgi:hypothetical protein
MAMRSALGSKPRLWCVLALTVVAAIAIVSGISSRTATLHAKEKRCPLWSDDRSGCFPT